MKRFSVLILFLVFFVVPSFAQVAVDYNTLINDCLTSVKNQQFAKAVDFCTDALQEKSDSGMAYYLRAVSYNKMSVDTATQSPSGETVKISAEQRKQFTVSDAEKCLQFIPNEYPCYSLIGTVLHSSKNNDELAKAVKNLNDAIRLGDKNKELYEYRAIANKNIALSMQSTMPEAKQRAEQAISDYDTYIQLSKNVLDYKFQANLYEFLGKFDLAIADYTKVLQEYENDYDLLFARGKLYLKTKKYQLAIDDFTSALDSADDEENSEFEENQKEILPFRLQAYKALKNKTAFCEDLKILDEKANCNKEWKKK